MKALGTASLGLEEVPLPAPGPGQVRIAVAASGINRADLAQRAGLYPPPKGASPILGLECSGVVDALGEGVDAFAIGDPVCALLAGGGCAEAVVCPAAHVLPVPRGVDLVAAAALPEAFATAWLNLWGEGALEGGERVVVHAAASGVGTAALQLCRALGNPAFATAGSDDKLARCLALGADAGWNRHQGSFRQAVLGWGGADVILDPVGGPTLGDNLAVLHEGGRLVIIAFLAGRTAELDLGRLLVKRLRIVGSTLRSRGDATKAAVVADLREHVWPLVESGAVSPVIDRVMPVAQAADAHGALERNETVGKVLLAW